MFFFIFHNSWKEERNGFKAYPDFGRGGGKDKFNVNNTHICEFRFDSGDIHISIGQGKKKTLRRSVFKHSFEDMKKPVVEGEKKPQVIRKSLRKLESLSRNK